MTTLARRQLKIRGMNLSEAANDKLDLPVNVAKGDDWDELSDGALKDLLQAEVEEVFDLLLYGWAAPWRMGDEEHQAELLKEAGDVINVLRFICSKYGAI